MSIKDRINELSEEELVSFITQTTKLLSSSYKRVVKSADNEINEDCYASRAKRTTLVANSVKNRQQFQGYVDDLYYAVRRLK